MYWDKRSVYKINVLLLVLAIWFWTRPSTYSAYAWNLLACTLISPAAFRRKNDISVINEARVSDRRNNLSVTTYSNLYQVYLVVTQLCPVLGYNCCDVTTGSRMCLHGVESNKRRQNFARTILSPVRLRCFGGRKSYLSFQREELNFILKFEMFTSVNINTVVFLFSWSLNIRAPRTLFQVIRAWSRFRFSGSYMQFLFPPGCFFCLEDGGSECLWNIYTCLPKYAV